MTAQFGTWCIITVPMICFICKRFTSKTHVYDVHVAMYGSRFVIKSWLAVFMSIPSPPQVFQYLDLSSLDNLHYVGKDQTTLK